jgi:carbonic anhydrase
MATVDTLVERNRQFSAEAFRSDLSIMPTLKAVVVACSDPRVDPVHVLGLDQGEAAVIRNVGGRVTPATIQLMAMLAAVAAGEGASGGWEILLMQHTDCGIKRLAQFPDVLAGYFGVGVDALPELAIDDPSGALRADIATLQANPMLPSTLVVSGLVYDVANGRVETVVPAGPLRDE